MAFQNLDVKKVQCFGWQRPVQDCWWNMANPTVSQGWSSLDKKKFEQQFSKNVNESYQRLFQADFEDLDDSIHYTCYFDNMKKLFNLELTNSKKGEILPEQKREFFKTETFKKTANRMHEIVERALKLYQETVKEHLENGELLAVDEVKIEAIEDLLEDQTAMKNIRLGKWMR